MAGKGRKHHQPTEDSLEVEVSGEENRSFLEMFIASQAKRDQENLERVQKEQIAAELRAEDRRIKAEIAAEEREEKRRERAKIAEEERAEARALLKEKRKREEAEKMEELALKREEAQKEKEEAARRAADRLAEKAAELQEEAANKAFAQQKALLELQADLGKKAAETSRLETAKLRARDRVISGLPSYQKGEDVESYLLMVEGKLKMGDLPDEEWIGVVAGKLTGELAVKWQELSQGEGDYSTVRSALLESSGYTPRTAGAAFHSFRNEHLKGMTGDQLYRRGVQLVQRMTAPVVLNKDALFRIVRPWIYACVNRRCGSYLDGRVIGDGESLVKGLQDYLASEGDKTSGKTAVFGGDSYGGPRRASFKPEHDRAGTFSQRERSGALVCFKCNKIGHKAADCWGARPTSEASGSSGSVVKGGAEGVAPTIICFTCREEGHKSPQCPKNPRNSDKGNGKEVKVKPVKRVWHQDKVGVYHEGLVNGHRTNILLDSGADISVVPESLVEESQKTGWTVAVRAFGASKPVVLPLAIVKFEMGTMSWEEEVAVSPERKDVKAEVLCRLDIQSERGLGLVLHVNEVKSGEVNRVMTRSQAQAEKKEEEEEEIGVARDQPKATPPLPNGHAVLNESREGVKPNAEVPGILVEDEKEDDSTFGIQKETSDVESEDDDEEVFEILEQVGEEPELVIPIVKKGKGSRATLVKEVGEDQSLEKWKKAAEEKVDGFLWDEGLLYKEVLTHELEKELLLVLPKSERKRVLVMAHDNLGHLGPRKVKAMIRRRFIWPNMGREVIDYCRSCEVCQSCQKRGARKVPLIERQVMTEPFESLGFDIVGPFPKGKGGYRFLLTAICMATKWPEALPLKSITAKSVALGMIEIFARTGIPLELITDQGSQFIGSVVSKLCANLKIEKIKTTPYHPEANGCIERMHGTLGPMLTKAAKAGQDWVGQIPFALFALRAAPNRDTLFSPYELVLGRQMRTPLDIVHQGWVESEFQELDVQEWAEWLKDRLEVMHDVQRDRAKKAGLDRKKSFDKKTVNRVLEKGDKVLCRLPGMASKLKESWHGPYLVVDKLNRVDYKIEVGKKKFKTLHINNMKKYFERELEVMRLVVVAEECEEESGRVPMHGSCDSFDRQMVVVLEEEFPDVFRDVPGRTGVWKLQIHTGDTFPIASGPYRVPDQMKDGVREELSTLLSSGVISESVSPWASPLLPVKKKDGSVRLCVDFRRLNSVTRADPYYMCTLEEILERVGGSQCLSKIDLKKGFYQIEVDPADREKTAFVSPFGKFQFNRMPFGLRNAPSVFQRVMEIVLKSCYHCCVPYIDDVVVFSGDGAEHVRHLREVLVALRQYGLTVNRQKCEFGKEQIEYLGHFIGRGQLAVPEHRASAMAEFRLPETKKQLRSFLGGASYFRRFIKNFANWSSLLTPDTSKHAPGIVCWDADKLEAFNTLKVSLVSVCVLTVPVSDDQFSLHTDASGAGVGATLNVIRNGEELPVGYYSQQLQGAQRSYSATELEGLAVLKSVMHFSHFLWGKEFTIYTDHRPLVALLKSRTLNKRLFGWLLKLMDYSFHIIYLPGSCNLDADCLSRQNWSTKEVGVLSDWRQLRAADFSEVGGDVGMSPTKK